jgi:dTDP-glucose pyrophosphorylase
MSNHFDQNLLIDSQDTLRSSMKRMTETGRKCLIVLKNKNFYATISDGDIRNALLAGNPLHTQVLKVANKRPFIFLQKEKPDTREIKEIFVKNKFELIPVLSNNAELVSDVLFWEDYLFNNEKYQEISHPVVIMAGGLGSRLKPFTDVLPKPLIPIGSKTVIERIIDQFLEHKIENYHISINHKSKILKAFFEELNPAYKVNFLYEEKPLGTGGSLFLLKNVIKSDFILTNCDVIFNIDLYDLSEFHKINKNLITIVASTKELTLPYGNLILDKKGNLQSTEEKPSFDFLVNTGMYIVSPEVLDTLQENVKIDFTEIIDRAIAENLKVGVYPINEDDWVDTGQWSEYKKAIDKLNNYE